MTTRKAHRLTLMFFILSIMASFGPCLYGVVRAFIEGSVVSKYSLGIVGVACIIIALVAALNKYRPRCIPWLLFIAIHIFSIFLELSFPRIFRDCIIMRLS